MKNILTQKEINHIDAVCKQYHIEDYTINPDGSIDVDGFVNLNNKGLNKLPLKFGKVRRGFYCDYNQLTSLEGSPSSVGGDFDCRINYLTSLEGCPSSLGGYFDCSANQITSLEGFTTSVGGDFVCDDNNLPDHFMSLYQNLSAEEINIFIKYQHDLRIWEDGYNEEEAQILYEEIKDGMR